MKIKLAILENDRIYLNRVVSGFTTKFPDNLTVFAFTNLEMALGAIRENRIDVFLACDSFDVNTAQLPETCGFAYLVDSANVETVRGCSAIFKFQRIELIYKQLLGMYAEKSDAVAGNGDGGSGTRVILFSSPSGGTGTSTAAAAFCRYFSAHGKKMLYLDLEKLESVDCFFSGEGQAGMSDVIYALKSGNPNLPLKLESAVKVDASGVYFYSSAKVALDMLEFRVDEMVRLINVLRTSGSYDHIVVDADFDIGQEGSKLLRLANRIVWVCDGSETSNRKIEQAVQALSILDKRLNVPVTGKLTLLYNKFSSKTGQVLMGLDIREAGGLPKFEHMTLAQMLNQLSAHGVMQNII